MRKHEIALLFSWLGAIAALSGIGGLFHILNYMDVLTHELVQGIYMSTISILIVIPIGVIIYRWRQERYT